MKVKAILFDLDGTLLPMRQEDFVKAYFGGIAKRLAPHGYDPDALINAIYMGTGAMIKNTSQSNNEIVFWDTFASILGNKAREDEKLFYEYYACDFDNVQKVCGFNDRAKEVIENVKQLGFRTILATNPLFPKIATHKRIKWAGLNPEDFELITTYDNSNRCKPNIEYYQQILDKAHLLPEECIMVGNDVEEDMIAATIGMKVFLLTDNIINKYDKDISVYPQGDFDKLLEFVKTINKE